MKISRTRQVLQDFMDRVRRYRYPVAGIGLQFVIGAADTSKQCCGKVEKSKYYCGNW